MNGHPGFSAASGRASLDGQPEAAAHRLPAFVPRAAANDAVDADAGRAPSPADELRAGLALPQATVSPKFLYDRLGSALFTAITELPEYYPTRTEAGIFCAHAAEMAAFVRRGLPAAYALVDLGAGDGAKAARLFPVLQPAHYVAVDISEDYLQQALAALQRQFPALRMTGVGLDFAQHLALPGGLLNGPALVFYPGSSIGNFSPDNALRLLRQAQQMSEGGALLIGADLLKPAGVLEAAYDDELGVTAAFNLNLLSHLNACIASNFRVRDWRHVALFNARLSRIEMHLEARHALHVQWPGGGRDFAAGERIHTENSHKWAPADFEALLRDAGWRQVRRWTDAAGWFGVFAALA
jgi:dimethylhistidine N-methyltransferase